jgi:phosphocarrier protein FPr
LPVTGFRLIPSTTFLRAPCAGEIVQQHAAGHAVTLKTASDVEVLMHIGIDTVTLKGQGFTPLVKVGDKVETGAPLIEFDLDYVATNAKSLLTEVIISNGERVSRMAYGSGTASVGKTPVLTLTLNGAAAAVKEEAGPTVMSEAIVLPNPNGLHARPAAVLSSMAKTFKSDIRLQLGERSANARSVTSLMALETARGDKVLLVAKGPDAREALDKLTQMIAEGLGDEGCVPASAPATMTVAPIAAPAPRKDVIPNLLTGVAASSGLAVGEVYQVRHVEIQVKEEGGSPDQERRLLDDTLAKAAGELEALRAQLHGHKEQAKAAIFAAHSELLEDPDLIEIATSAIAKGKSAAFAWKNAVKAHAERLAGLRNQLLAHSVPTTFGTLASGCWRSSQGSSEKLPLILPTLFSLLRILRPRTPLPWSGARSWVLRLCGAGLPRMLPFWRARSVFRRSPASRRVPWNSPMAHPLFSTAVRARCGSILL